MFPYLYHAHHDLHSDDLPYWLDLAARCSGPILELGCGTGRVLIPLAQAGNEVYGLDIAPDMLAFLRQKIDPALLSHVFIFQADFTHFHLAMRFGLILLPCNIMSTLPAEERRTLLKCVHDHLQPEGLFVASMPNPLFLRSLPAKSESEVEEILFNPINGEPIQVSCSWKRTKLLFTLQWHYDRLLPDGIVERHSTHVTHILTEPQIYLEEISCAGFKSYVTFGDFDRSIFSLESPYCIIQAS